VGGHSRWVSQELKKYGHEVIIADARKLRLIYENPRKSDRVDAEYLAKLVRLDPSLLSPVIHRGAVAQQHLAILRARDSLVQARTQLVNHVRGTAKSFGCRLPHCSTDSFGRKAQARETDSYFVHKTVFFSIELLGGVITQGTGTFPYRNKKFYMPYGIKTSDFNTKQTYNELVYALDLYF
jgi:transposase